jgi:hypothetical protein
MKPSNLFDENDKKIPKGFLIIIGGFAVLICFWVYFSIGGDFSKLKNIFSSDAIKYWISVFAGFITSLFATFFYEYNKSLKNAEKLKFLRNIAHKDLLADIVSELQFYNNRYYEFYNITGTLKHSEVKNFVEVTIDYSFRKVLNKGSVDLQFIRIRNEDERQRLKEKKIMAPFWI